MLYAISSPPYIEVETLPGNRYMVASQNGGADGIAVLVGNVAFLQGEAEAVGALLVYGLGVPTVVSSLPLTAAIHIETYTVYQAVAGTLTRHLPSVEIQFTEHHTPPPHSNFEGDAFTEAALAAPTRHYTAEQQGEVVAWGSVSQHMLYSVWVSETKRRAGIGTALSHYMAKQLIDTGTDRITAIVKQTHTAANRMLKRVGFMVTDYLREYRIE